MFPLLRTVRVTRAFPDFDKGCALYYRAFPPEEQLPMDALLDGTLATDFQAIYNEDNHFCGFFSYLNHGDISHIMFLAVEEEFRERGYGSRALSIMSDILKGKRIILDIEDVLLGETEENAEQRKKRKAFYLRNGYRESGIRYYWKDVPYELLVSGGSITAKEFQNFWLAFRRKNEVILIEE